MKKIFNSKYFALFMVITVVLTFGSARIAHASIVADALSSVVDTVANVVSDAVDTVVNVVTDVLSSPMGMLIVSVAACYFAGACINFGVADAIGEVAVDAGANAGFYAAGLTEAPAGLTLFDTASYTGYFVSTGIPVPALNFGSGPNAGLPSNLPNTPMSCETTCYGPTNSCGQSYSGTWKCGFSDFVSDSSSQPQCVLTSGSTTATPPESGCPPPAPVTPAPDCATNAAPDTINQGQTSVLVWGCSNTDSATMDNGIGSVPVTSMNGNTTNNPNFVSGGSKSWQQFGVSPLNTTTYTLSATGPGGTATFPITVTVNANPAPNCAFVTNPDTIDQGQSTRLVWGCQNATSCSIDNGIGSVPTNSGAKYSVSPTQTTTYNLSCTGPGGNSSFPATVTVNIVTVKKVPATVTSVSVSPVSTPLGTPATLSWTSTNADTCNIDNGIGQVGPNSSTSVNPSQTTTYTITCTGAGGTSAPSTATLTVYQPPACSTFSASPSQIVEGNRSTLSWTCSNVDNSCSLSAAPGTTFSGTGSYNVSPTKTTNYTLSCTGNGGTRTFGTSVTVYENPVCIFSSSPSTIVPPQSSTLSWSCTKATSCKVTSPSGTLTTGGANGSVSVAPRQTTSYTLSCAGDGNGVIQGQSSFQTTLRVTGFGIQEVAPQ